eukprot:scaffold247217_cov23-Tisochrysis_lutea.AAC.2
MSRAFDLVYEIFSKASTDGSLLLDPELDVFRSIADEQPKFAAWRKYMYEEETVLSPNGKQDEALGLQARSRGAAKSVQRDEHQD